MSRLLALLGLMLALPTVAHAFDCSPKGVPWRLDATLPVTAARLASGAPVTIVAIGSSSTWGAGASSRDKSYPSRLAAELAERWPGRKVNVVNRGIGGEVASETLSRFARDVAAEKPDLVIWQVGTNDLAQGVSPSAFAEIVRTGLHRIRDVHADAILMDAQYAPAVLNKPNHATAVGLVEKVGQELDVPVFHRFAAMQVWVETQKAGFGDLLNADGLHMNDVSYACLARLIADAIAEGVDEASPAAPVIARLKPSTARSVSMVPSPRTPPLP
jgi:lysophospholipase L1-like esterase